MQNNILSEKDTKVVLDILVEQIGLREEQITLDARIIDDLGADSLTVIEITLALEERFSLSIPDEKLESVSTVRDLFELLAELLGGSALQAA
jgi:acyl carrier protein